MMIYQSLLQARKILRCEGKAPWLRKTGDEDFDVSIGCFDGAQICKLVGTYFSKNLLISLTSRT